MKLKALIAEFIGTFALLFAGVGSIVMVNFMVPNEPKSAASLIIVALAHGLAIAVCGSAMGHISGGHFNPAVSLGMAVARKIDFMTMIGYWIAQFAGGIVGTFMVMKAVDSPGAKDYFDTINGGLPEVNALITSSSAMLLEGIGTFFLVLVVLGTCVDRRAAKMGAWYAGLTITMMILTFGPLTGGSINPARWFGPALVRSLLTDLPVYLAGPAVGAILAAIIYAYLLAPEEFKREAPAEAA